MMKPDQGRGIAILAEPDDGEHEDGEYEGDEHEDHDAMSHDDKMSDAMDEVYDAHKRGDKEGHKKAMLALLTLHKHAPEDESGEESEHSGDLEETEDEDEHHGLLG